MNRVSSYEQLGNDCAIALVLLAGIAALQLGLKMAGY